MIFWRLLQPVLLGSAFVIGGVGAVYALSYLLAWVARRLGDDGPTLQDRPTSRAGFGATEQEVREGDALRTKAEARRERALQRYHEAHGIASGEPESPRRVTLVDRRWK